MAFEAAASPPRHELIGHAASLACPEISRLNRLLGSAASCASRSTSGMLGRIERVYWWVLEFGLVREGREVKAVGAGLLSSADELSACQDVEHAPWDLERMARTDFDPTAPQSRLFVAPSYSRMLVDVEDWVEASVHR